MLNIWIDSFARAGGIDSGIDARDREPMQPASETDARPEPATVAGAALLNPVAGRPTRAIFTLPRFKAFIRIPI